MPLRYKKNQKKSAQHNVQSSHTLSPTYVLTTFDLFAMRFTDTTVCSVWCISASLSVVLTVLTAGRYEDVSPTQHSEESALPHLAAVAILVVSKSASLAKIIL